MERVLLTPEEETRTLLQESRELRKWLKEGNPFSSKDVNRVVRKMIASIEDLTDLIAVGANIDRRLRPSLRREIKDLVGGAIEVAGRSPSLLREIK